MDSFLRRCAELRSVVGDSARSARFADHHAALAVELMTDAYREPEAYAGTTIPVQGIYVWPPTST